MSYARHRGLVVYCIFVLFAIKTPERYSCRPQSFGEKAILKPLT